MAKKFAGILGIILLAGAMLPGLQQNVFASLDLAITVKNLSNDTTLSDGDIIYVDKEDGEVQLEIIVTPSSEVTMSEFPDASLEVSSGAYRFSWPVDRVVISDPSAPQMYGVTFVAQNGDEVAAKSILIGVERNLRAALSLDRTGYSPGENATITVRDPHANKNALAMDTTVAKVRFAGSGMQTRDVTLAESLENPNVFVGNFTVANGKKVVVQYDNVDAISADIGRFITFDKSVYHKGDVAKITLYDERRNLRLAQVDSIQVSASSGTHAIQVPISETNASSGVFEGYVRLGSGAGSIIPMLPVLQNSDRISDEVVVSLGRLAAKASVIEPRFEVNHNMSATRDIDIATFTLVDNIFNVNSKAKDRVEVTVRSGSSSILNTLIETGPDTGIFGSISKMVLTTDSALASESPQHSLVVQNGVITASYPAVASLTERSASFPVEIAPEPAVPARLMGVGTDGASPSPADPVFSNITLLDCGPGGDLDGDGICDSWEAGGYLKIPYGGVTHTMFPFSCTPECPSSTTKDVYVEIDYDSNYLPNQIALDYVRDRFNLADPVYNPSGVNGIKLHSIISDDIGARSHRYIWTNSTTADIDSYTEIKTQYFGISHSNPLIGFHLSTKPDKTMAWAQVAHYVEWIDKQNHDPGSSGLAEVTGNDMIVSLGSFLPDPTAVDKQQGTYLHELGHNLGLGHGGSLVHDDNSINCKPNYLSAMSYARQLTTYIGSGQDYSRGAWSFPLTIGNLNESVAPGMLPPNFTADIVYNTSGLGSSAVAPTSQYRFDGNGNDSIGSNHLTLFNSPAFGSDGPFDNYIAFNGVDQYARAADNAFDVTTQDFSIWGYLYRTFDTLGEEEIVSKLQLSPTITGYRVLIGGTDKLTVQLWLNAAAATATTTSSISTNTWYFWAASYDRDGNVTVYLYNLSNGAYETKSWPAGSTTASISTTRAFTIGKASSTSSYFPGYIDHLSFLDGTALSEDQVSQIFNQYVSGGSSVPVVTSIDASTDWIDWNGNGTPDMAANDVTDIGISGCTPSSNQFDPAIPLRDHNDWEDIVSGLNFRSANPAAVTTGSRLVSHGLAVDDLKGFRELGIRSVDAAIQNTSDHYFNGNATLIKADYRKQLLQDSSVLSFVRSNDVLKAVAKLEAIRETMDERGGGNPADDKIQAGGQGSILPVLDSNIAALKMELDAPYKAPHTFQIKSYSGNKVYTITGNSTTITSAVNTFTFNNATKTVNLDLIGSGDVILEIPSELATTVTDVSRGGQTLTFLHTSASPTVKVLIKDLPYYPRSTTVGVGGVVPPKDPLEVFPTQLVGPGKEVNVTISDCDINNDSDLINMGNVTVTVDNGSSATLKVLETGVNTCIFVGTVTLNPNEHPGSTGSGTTHVTANVVPGDIVAVRYEYVEGGTTKTATRTFEVENEDPTMATTEGIYIEGDIIGLTIDDFDANLDSRSFDSIEVRVTSDSDPVGFDVTAIETERDSGIFSITVPTTTSASSGAITARTGDDIYFEYTDRFPADYVDRLGSVSDPSKDFILTVRIAPDGITSIDPGTPTLEDISGNPLTEVSAGMQVFVSSTIKNNSDVAQPFAAVIEVRDADGFTIFLSWQTGTLPASGQSEPGLSWTPAAPGDYTIRVFVLESVSSPTVLSPIAELAVTVDGSRSVHLPPVSPPSSGTIES